MGKAMTKSQIASHFADKFGMKKKFVLEIFAEIAELAYREAPNQFPILGVGKLVLVQRKARQGRNPATGETIQIPAKKVVKFKVAKAAKDAILGKK